MTGSGGPVDHGGRDARYEQLVELAPDAILVHDDGFIVLANAAAVRLAGATHRGEVVGTSIERFLDPPYLKAVQTEIAEDVTPAEGAPPVRDRFRRLDGTTVEVEVRAVAFLDQGRASAHLVIRDIRERLALERSEQAVQQRLQDAQRMESIGALAGGVAHEVNNKLQVVLAFSSFLMRDAHLPPAALADVREIVRATDRAAAVTRQLLAFSRRAAHRPRVIDLAFCVTQSEPALRTLLGEDRRLVTASSAAPAVWADPEQLEQVILNLTLNSRDAMLADGTVTLTTGQSDVIEGGGGDIAAADGVPIPAGRYATLCVSDTGSGIADSIRARLFEPFFTTKLAGMGTGLGLAAVHGVVSQNGGYITVDSTPGKGTTFTVYLPVLDVTESNETRATLRASSPDTASETPRDATAGAEVLVVDDEPAVLAVATRILEQGGYRVRGAADGAEALDTIEHLGPPQLVLTDLLMRRIGGAELARLLKERWPTLPIIFMSGYSAEELYRQGAIALTGELIQKPFAPGALVALVAAALTRAEVSGSDLGA